LTGKHEGIKTGRRQGRILDGINEINKIGIGNRISHKGTQRTQKGTEEQPGLFQVFVFSVFF